MTDHVIEIVAGATGVVLAVADDGRLHQLGFGSGVAGRMPEFPVGIYPLAYPTFGEEPTREPALRVTHADGATSTRLRFVAADVEAHEHGELHRIELADRVAPVGVTLWFRTWPAHDLLEAWVEVVNLGPDELVLHEAAATAPAFAASSATLTHWGGGWAGVGVSVSIVYVTEALSPSPIRPLR